MTYIKIHKLEFSNGMNRKIAHTCRSPTQLLQTPYIYYRGMLLCFFPYSCLQVKALVTTHIVRLQHSVTILCSIPHRQKFAPCYSLFANVHLTLLIWQYMNKSGWEHASPVRLSLYTALPPLLLLLVDEQDDLSFTE